MKNPVNKRKLMNVLETSLNEGREICVSQEVSEVVTRNIATVEDYDLSDGLYIEGDNGFVLNCKKKDIKLEIDDVEGMTLMFKDGCICIDLV